MIKTSWLRFMAAAILLVMSVGYGVASDSGQSGRFDVPDNGLCLFGHWISGTVEVALAEGYIVINGIKLAPPTATGDKESEVAGPSTDRGLLTREMYRIQESLAANKVSSDTVTTLVLEFLAKSSLVDQVEQLQGVVYRIHWADGNTTMVNIGSMPGQSREPVRAKDRSGDFYGRLCTWLSTNKVVIISSGGLVVLPARMRTDPAFLAEVSRARTGAGKWDVATWGNASFFPSLVAEEMRVPMDLSNREVTR